MDQQDIWQVYLCTMGLLNYLTPFYTILDQCILRTRVRLLYRRAVTEL